MLNVIKDENRKKNYYVIFDTRGAGREVSDFTHRNAAGIFTVFTNFLYLCLAHVTLVCETILIFFIDLFNHHVSIQEEHIYRRKI